MNIRALFFTIFSFQIYFHHKNLVLCFALIGNIYPVADQGEPLPPYFWWKKEEMTEGRKAGWANKIKPGPLLSSKSGSATVILLSIYLIHNSVSWMPEFFRMAVEICLESLAFCAVFSVSRVLHRDWRLILGVEDAVHITKENRPTYLLLSLFSWFFRPFATVLCRFTWAVSSTPSKIQIDRSN